MILIDLIFVAQQSDMVRQTLKHAYNLYAKNERKQLFLINAATMFSFYITQLIFSLKIYSYVHFIAEVKCRIKSFAPFGKVGCG